MQSIQLQNDSLVEIATFLIRRWSEEENITIEISDNLQTKTRLKEKKVILTPLEKLIGSDFQKYRQFRTSSWYEAMKIKYSEKILSDDHAFGFILNAMETKRVEQLGRKIWKGMDEEIIFNYSYMLVSRPQLHTVYGKARIVEAFYQYFMFGIIKGEIIEKGGVNISTVSGEFSDKMRSRIPGTEESAKYWATGISVVIHPFSPLIPSMHFNSRYLKTSKSWFGGGVDITPATPFEEETKNFHKKIKEVLEKKNTLGLNVTIPFKKSVIPFLDQLTLIAKEAQSVNTIFKKDNKIVGDNTDIGGFEYGLKHINYNVQNKKVFILGAGGVVPSIILALKKLGVFKISLSNRTKEKAVELKKIHKDLEVINW